MSLSPLAPSPDEARHWAKRFRTEIASSTSTVCSTMLAFPLESVKTRIQSYPDGFTSCVRKVWLDEGLKGFWRGVLIPLVSVTVVRTVSFSVYQKAKYKSSAFIATVTGKEEPLIVVNKPGSLPDFATVACFGMAGAVAGAASTFIACPFELTKNAMVIAKQIAATSVGKNENPIRISYENKGTWRTARQIVKNCGFLGLWSGFQLQMIRETFGTAMYFIVYESGKQLAVKYQGHDSPTSPLAVTAAGGLCGMAGLVSTYPIDRAKTAYQRACLEQGSGRPALSPRVEYFKRASYQGLAVAASRSALTGAVFFSAFEFLKKQINALPDPVQDLRDGRY